MITFIFSPEQFKSQGSIDTLTCNWFPHSKAYSKRATIARLIREETGRLLLFDENNGRKRPTALDVSGAEAKPPKLLKVQKSKDTVPVPVTTAVAKPASVLVKTSNLDLMTLKVTELRAKLSALGLPKSGNKGVLIARLQAHIAEGNPNSLKRIIDNSDS